MHIRKATPDDAWAIKQIHNRAYQISYRGYIPDEYLDNICLTEDILQRTRNYLRTNECYVIEQEGKIIAFSYVTYPQEKCFEINALYVDPNYQRCGAGAFMVNDLCENKKSDGLRKCIVWTMADGPSVGFYEKLQFYRTGNQKAWKFNIPIIELVRQI